MSTPIITCGDHEPDAIGVHAGMKPEYEGWSHPRFYRPELAEMLTTYNQWSMQHSGFLKQGKSFHES